MLTDECFVKYEEEILEYSYKDFSNILSIIPRIKENEKVSHTLIPDFLLRVSESRILVSFNWGDWQEGNEIIEDENFDYNALDILGVCKLLTAIIQSERYIDGGLRDYFKDGTILKILEILDSKLKCEKL